MNMRKGKWIFLFLFVFSFLLPDGTEILHFLGGTQEALAAAPESSWWNLNYGARKKITISAGSDQVPVGYSVSTTLGHEALVDAKQSLANGNDVRIVYCNSCSGSSGWVELDRIIDPGTSWNNGDAKIWFKTQALINGSATDDNYYIYYSYPSAGSPPTKSTNVFLLHSGFESGDFEDFVGAWFTHGESMNVVNSSVIAPNKGTGLDGSRTISSGTTNIASVGGVSTAVTADPTGSTQITVNSTSGFSTGDEILLIDMRGALGETDDVGKYEFLRIASINGNNLNLETAVRRTYHTNGFTNQKLMVQRVPQWTTVTIENGGTLTASAWDGTTGGVIAFRATGAVTINGGGAINADALGYRGGTGGGGTAGGNNGETYDGYQGSGGNDTTSGSGGGNLGTYGGGASSNAGPGTSGDFDPSDAGEYRGGGGGGGNADASTADDGAGGGGGGGYGGGGGGGGGGAGGSSYNGGAGGSGGDTGVGGGGGGSGRTGTNGGAGGNAGSVGGGVATLAAAGWSARTGQGGNGGSTSAGPQGAGGGGGGGLYGFNDLAMRFCLGSGGGGGGDHDSGSVAGQSGGAGGGIIFIAANSVSNGGTISANGAAGTSTSGISGAGGGGSGGSILIYAGSVTTNGATNFTATGGNGGTTGAYRGGGGGQGGVGRIRIEATTVTGLTNPTYFVASGNPVHTGIYSAKSETTNSDDPDYGYAIAEAITFFDPAHSAIYATGYFYLADTFPTTAGEHVTLMNIANSWWQNILALSLADDNTLYVYNTVDDEAYAKGTPTVLSTGTWHRIDVKFVISDTAGEAKVWLNGSPEIEATGKDTKYDSASYDISQFAFGIFVQSDETDENTLYFDDCFVRKGVSSEPSTGLATAEGRYEYRKKLTIQSGEVGDTCVSEQTNLTNFPVLVSLSGDWLKTKTVDPTNGRIYNSSGYDICFRGADPETILNYEIEKYDGTNGILVAWVKIPTVYYNQNTDFYIYYGNPAITSGPAASVAQGVWSNSYAAVYHLNGNANDSTGNHNGDVLGASSTTDGNFAGAYSFNGSSNWIDTNFSTTYGSFTIEAWFYRNNSGSLPQYAVGSKYGNSMAVIYQGGTYFTWEVYDSGGGGNDALLSGNYHSAWHYTALTREGNSFTGYLDDNTPETDSGCSGTVDLSDSDFAIGALNTNDSDQSGWFNGKLDEVRFSSVKREACWIETSFSSMNAPSSFISEGTETSPTPTAVTLKSFKALQFGDGVLLKWKTSHEVNNLGFNVYREANGELLRLTPEMITGSALLAGSGTPLTAGHQYVWWDNSITSDQLSAISSQRSVVRYYLEDVDLTGKKTWHGPVEVELSAPRSPLSASDFRRAELLSEFGMKLQEKYADFWKAQDLREKIKARNVTSYTLLGKTKNTNNESRITNHAALGAGQRSAVLGPRANIAVSSVDDRNEAPAGRMTPARLSDKPLKQCQEVQQALAASPAMKLLVKEEGWYRVSQGELAAAGMNTNFNPRHLHLYADGQEVPIRVIAEKENRFGPRDSIEFYGTGLDTPSTDTRVYWLVVGSRPGKRMPVSRAQGGQASLTAFPFTAESKERSFYYPALLNGEENNFFGPILYTYRVDQLLYVWDADMSSREDALLEVALQGATAGPHRVKVFFNDLEAGEVSFMGQSQGRFLAEIPVSVLQPGENLVSFIAHGGEMDVSLLDSIRLTYLRNYRAHENGLKLTAQGGSQVSVTGFSHAQVQVVDITDPLSVVEVEGKVSKTQGSGYEVSFRVPGSGPRTLLAQGVENARSPAQLLLNQPSRWHQGRNGYDLVIVSHRDFLESLKPLKNLRENQGYSVALVDVDDVYDEFSFGSKNPQAIKDFLQRASSSWQKPPRFVLLAGDASYDPRNFLGYGELDFVPTKLLDTAYLETASDDWFVDFDEDGLPDMALGRLPVQTAAEASAMVAKIVAYEKSARTNEALLVADKTEQTDDFDFVRAAQKVGALFPSSVGLRKVFRGEYGSDAQAKEALLYYLGQGSLLVNYVGHGGMMEWRGHVFTTEDAEALTNGGRLPFFVNMTCLNGFFQAPYGDTLAESLLKAENGGAVAVWTSSGMTLPQGQSVMNQELVRQLFNGEDLTIGEAAMRAKRAVKDQDIRRTWILFGDPTTRLKR